VRSTNSVQWQICILHCRVNLYSRLKPLPLFCKVLWERLFCKVLWERL
jgi:hypothetical protein